MGEACAGSMDCCMMGMWGEGVLVCSMEADGEVDVCVRAMDC